MPAWAWLLIGVTSYFLIGGFFAGIYVSDKDEVEKGDSIIIFLWPISVAVSIGILVGNRINKSARKSE